MYLNNGDKKQRKAARVQSKYDRIITIHLYIISLIITKRVLPHCKFLVSTVDSSPRTPHCESHDQSTAPNRRNEIVVKLRCSFAQFSCLRQSQALYIKSIRQWLTWSIDTLEYRAST